MMKLLAKIWLSLMGIGMAGLLIFSVYNLFILKPETIYFIGAFFITVVAIYIVEQS